MKLYLFLCNFYIHVQKMDVRKIPFAGLQLLLLLHATHSFVLLTANIEDVKKLAMKFVSESLAEKIAGFLAQAASQMISQVSEEVKRDLSEENKEYNIRQESSEREFAKDRRIRSKAKKGIKKVDYRKDDVFSEIASDKYTTEKKPPLEYAYDLNQQGKVFKDNQEVKLYQLKFSTPVRKSNDLSEGLSFKKNHQPAEDLECSSATLSIENNTINNDDKNKTKESALQIRFRSKGKAPNETTENSKLIATSGLLKLTKITTDRPSDDENSEHESENEKKEEEKEDKKEETWF